MKYFIDQEFIEGFHKPLFGKRRHFIDLISIGIVAEDGRKYFALSSEYDPSMADKWVHDNVLMPLYTKAVSGDSRNQFSVYNFHKHFGKSNKQIAAEILMFIKDPWSNFYNDWLGPIDDYLNELKKAKMHETTELYGYYSAYDHVLFCSLFGRMIDLPEGFPMYTIDLKQMLDERVRDRFRHFDIPFQQALDGVKANPKYPKNNDEHDALADAIWNQELYQFIQNL